MSRLPRKLPDLTTPARLALLAVFVAVVASAVSYADNMRWMRAALGDTDDATRLVMVRELLAGRGWWDQHWLRLQPPVGVYMHWSRLLDGGLAGLTLLFRLVLSPADAEYATRIVWPGLWIIPAAWAEHFRNTAVSVPGKCASRRQSSACALAAINCAASIASISFAGRRAANAASAARSRRARHSGVSSGGGGRLARR